MEDKTEGAEAEVAGSVDARNAAIVRASVVSIAANVVLAGLKAAIGVLSNSIAITLDAVNNLSDAMSSIITIVGTKLASRRATREHPYGFGRIEYLTTIVIAAIVLWAGITSLGESVTRIFSPETPSYDGVTLLVVAIAVVGKVVLGSYVKGVGDRVGSDTLVASGTDALTDSLVSAATLVAAVVYVFAGVSLEAYLGVVIALVIIKAGVDILGEAIAKILGQRVEPELANQIKAVVRGVDGVNGAYDLVLNDYGPERLTGSVHVEVDEDLTAYQIDTITRKIQVAVYRECGVMIHTVGIYSTNMDTPEMRALREEIRSVVMSHEYVRGFHGFYVDATTLQCSFDAVMSFDAPDMRVAFDEVVADVEEKFPEYTFRVNMDLDFSD